MDYGMIVKSIILQVSVFCFIPFLYWIIKRRKEISFLNYVGLHQIKKTGKWNAIVLFGLTYLVVYGLVHFVPFIANLTQPSANAYAGSGVAAIIPAILVCFLQQALAEEILFRSFIGKRSISKFGFQVGNAIQAIIFGMSHVLFSISSERDIIAYLIIGTSIAMGGWLLGYVDEKLCGGSILPSLILHAIGNFVMIMTVAF